MKICQYCERQRCRHVELEQFWQASASRGFVSDSWAFLLIIVLIFISNRNMNSPMVQSHLDCIIFVPTIVSQASQLVVFLQAVVRGLRSSLTVLSQVWLGLPGGRLQLTGGRWIVLAAVLLRRWTESNVNKSCCNTYTDRTNVSDFHRSCSLELSSSYSRPVFITISVLSAAVSRLNYLPGLMEFVIA